MDNYYDSTLKEIRKLISESKKIEALSMVEEELSMPYIPSEYKREFERLRDSLVKKQMSQTPFFTSMEEIEVALFEDEAQKAKALLSLENMNLRPYIDDLIQLLRKDLDDFTKRMILMISMEQELSYKAFLTLNNQPYTIEISDLVDPFQSQHYIAVYQELKEMFESHDPSFLKLCQEVLNLLILQTYPFVDESISLDRVIEKTHHFLNQG